VKNIQGKFYPLTPSICRKLRQSRLTKHKAALWFYLTVEVGLFEDKCCQLPLNEEVSEELEMSKASYFRALKVLNEKGLLPEWCKKCVVSKNNIEMTIRDRMKEELGGAVEVLTAVGRIDLLTDTEVIEIKNINDSKQALDKLLAYSSFFSQHSKRIHLFGRLDIAKLAQATAMYKDFDITVTFEEV
jgi:hypothetical protein